MTRPVLSTGVKVVRADGVLAFIDPSGEASQEDSLKEELGTDDYATHYANEDQIVWVNVPDGSVEFFSHSTGEFVPFGGEE
jgi:hypothetical protein